MDMILILSFLAGTMLKLHYAKTQTLEIQILLMRSQWPLYSPVYNIYILTAFKIFLFIFGSQKIYKGHHRCGFLCIFLAWGSLSFLNL